MSVNPTLFRQALAQFASGVTVVTAAAGTARHGFTATSFASVSLQPPLVLVCAARRLEAISAVEHGRALGVNVLGVHQQQLALRFAGLLPGVEDRFDGVDTIVSVTGSPLLPASLAWLDCRLWRIDAGGDHAIIIGEVADARVNEHHVPLLYHDRHWRRPADLEDDLDVVATHAAPSILALDELLRGLQPSLDPSRYVFVSVAAAEPGLVRGAFASVREAEGTTLILTRDAAVERGLPSTPVFRRIVLAVFSDLMAVGLLATVTEHLRRAGVACNAISAYHHDHLFVPEADAERAVAALRDLQARSR